jgi:multiple sugar transport system permease protein/raffinose/stachyose/melibiose transport system permease protein
LILLGFPWVGGTSVLIYLSGLMSISDEIFEAATLDGCGKWRRIFSIDMPLCMGQFRYFLIFGIINGLQDYGIQIVLYKIAPDYVYVPGYYLYRMAYTNDRSGYASAIGVCLFIVIISLTLLANRLTKKDKEAA